MADGTDKDNGDYLGYGVYADTLWSRVEAALSKDQGDPTKLGDDPLVVGIFGEWGAGKSKLLSLILERAQRQRSERIAAHKRDDGFSLTVPVFFQPWKYEHEKHLLVPLLLHIEAELSRCLTLAESTSDRAKGKAVAVAEAVKAHVPAVVEGFKTLWGAARTAYQLAEPASAGVLLPLAEWLAGRLAPDGSGQEKGASPHMAKFRWDAEGGRSYYELHEVLRAVTRPTPEGFKRYLPGAKVDSSFRINFVIFIDDLDRCLPEKAVETLELIKTVFNLESFAFVLALDEEVVERGIGHRYKDYALQNKKPEMPITGFEYLEKIVHLPFRLPLLTEQQGLQFLARHESALLEEQVNRRWPGKGDAQQVNERSQWLDQRRWFSADGGRYSWSFHARDRGADGSTQELSTGMAEPGGTLPGARFRLHLGHMVLGSFNAHVPRKLIRVVELFNQVQDVLEAMKPPRQLVIGSEYDPRSVLALLLLQLFQPDLYRSLRRSADTFELFFDAFKPVNTREPRLEERVRRQLSATTADADLLHWAVYFHDDQPPGSLRAAQLCIPKLDVAERHAAQHKRLPLVERLLEHRSIQRHPFDPLKLMQLLEQSARADKIPLQLNGRLFALLAREATESQQIPRELVETVVAPAQNGGPNDIAEGGAKLRLVATGEGSSLGVELTPTPALVRPHTRTVEPPDINALFLALVAPDEATQKTVAQVAGLAAGETLGSRSAQALIAQVEREFLRGALDKGGDERDMGARRLRLAQGLTYLAPHLAQDDALAFWNLTGLPVPQWEPAEAHQSTTTLKDAALRADLYVALGLDKRFDPSFFYLPKNQYPEHDNQKEPFPGFVWVQKERADFQPTAGSIVSLAPFLMARYLTTVDQFGAFVEGGGYKNSDWWDSQGWAWVTAEWDRHPTTPTWLKERLGQRPVEARQAPALWAQQRPGGSSPVWGVNWFEARAYARWLNQQEAFRLRLNEVNLGNARVELPIEAQWERAARAAGFESPPDGREYVWNDEKAEVALRANIDDSGLGEASPVGLFPSSPLGICDLNGNLWEWQDNLHADKAPHPAGQRIRPLQSPAAGSLNSSDWLVMGKEWSDSATPALRGGAWGSTADFARASFRYRYLPGFWLSYVGFRVVLSLAE